MHREKHFRHELKYAIPYGDYLSMRARLKMIMTPDSHTASDGKYKTYICSKRINPKDIENMIKQLKGE